MFDLEVAILSLAFESMSDSFVEEHPAAWGRRIAVGVGISHGSFPDV